MTVVDLQKELESLGHPEKSKGSQRFFKTGKGQYGEGDIFLGITVPQQRAVARKYTRLSLGEIKILLNSTIHEFRFTALEVLVMKYDKASIKERERIYNFYLDNASSINNWDLVDTSAPYILGRYLLGKDKKVLFKLAKSNSLWERRIAMVSTYTFIQDNKFETTFKVCELLMKDKHDLIHKACGWMLREVGKRDEKVLKVFLKKHYMNMPRTMLRYAIERFSQDERKRYLGGTI